MNISNRVSRIWARYKKYRQLQTYYRSQFGSFGGGKYILFCLLFLAGGYYVLQQATTFRQVLPQLLLIIVVLIISLQIIVAWEFSQLRKLCREKLGEAEYRKRLEKTPLTEVLLVLCERISSSFGISALEVRDQVLQGVHQGEQWGVYFRYIEQDEVLQTQEMIALLRECKQKGITQVRVFVNTDFSPKAKVLGERFEVILKTYNGRQLKKILRDSPIYPSLYEIDTIIRRDSEKRLRRLVILKKEAVQGNKFFTYLVYGVVLLSMAWFGMGYTYWNTGFGLIMLVLAVLSFRKNWFKQDEEEMVF